MNVLKQKRKKLCLTQVQAANACGVSRRTYQTYEETDNNNSTYLELINKLDEMGIFGGANYVSNVKCIKTVCRQLFKEKYPEIKCAYLFGSYAKGVASGKSDIDILIVCSYTKATIDEVITELEDKLHKKVDLHTHEELFKNKNFLEIVLKEGIKIYG